MTISHKHYLESKAWPFEEAQRIYKKIAGKTPAKGFVLFETGYGPSGLPHIGTFGEVVRTSFVRHAFQLIAPEIPTKMFCVSDDIDGLRKVPENVPQQELLRANLGKPLTSVSDPFGTHESYGHHMNARLRSFLDGFGFEYEFISATEKYKYGAFDKTMLRVLEKYEELMELMLPTLGAERQETYSPFMPIDRESGIVIDKGVKCIDKTKGTVIYVDGNGHEKEVPVTGGNCKLQWKIDFGARWYSLDVDYEIYGKDHQPNEKIYRRVCEILGGTPPVNFTYEMFLSESGEKISKSKGNGISVEDWLKYAPSESMALFMYQKPKTAKRLYFDVIPKMMDEYLAFAQSFATQEMSAKLDNPAFHIHKSNVPEINFNLNYSLLLNLASACNPENDAVLWGFISKYQQGLTPENSPLLAKMVHCAIRYYNDFIRKNKKFRKATEDEKSALIELCEKLPKHTETSSAQAARSAKCDSDELQKIVFEVGRNHGYEQKMREWFLALYQILLGQDQGPRMGSFIALFGVENFVKLVEDRL
ncbi:MAG: lysine--tRNA ligase [Alphaproteobacteria bacterium RIFCSPLOWO2_01_FULL_40_26]|nr:MAG: lysine--tRNA ligase [Alphaproteobacteria bacterium RIFCSPHIGHO2_02_FULL_40_34]OFW94217.1 MAG: lysine--tRNA ligase [Alphaproteobacteria bacterium RIFCSPLOWO2_01_FULL_40_26]OFX09786.1 MAG: lysine--tRNA ligase [Alphaproteobacteria bacterium RIFCSPLOWO2_02_FULL_40_19]OFX12273.1 MAG: lysine--tRNA ligase [Alphaproteobacteria bacterium RIFCSPLOWO2_12_FULL_40_11]